MRNKKSKRGFIMKKFMEFLKENSGMTNGDEIGLLLSVGMLIGCGLCACKKLQDLKLENADLLFQLESKNIQDEIEKIIDVTTESSVDLDF